MSCSLVLASASPARHRLLRDAGIAHDVVVSGVDEDDAGSSCQEQVLALAIRKARAVAARRPDVLVVGCDSLLELGGAALGKPATAADAIARWHDMRGRSATLRTGHCVIDGATGRQVSAVGSTLVRFGRPSDAEIGAYVATGEPLGVAGAFTLDGFAVPFIDGVDGDPSNVIGLSLPLLRSLLAELGIDLVELWTTAPSAGSSP